MIYLKVKDDKLDILLNYFPDNFIAPAEDEYRDDKTRYIRKNVSFGVLEVLMKKEKRITDSNKVFKAVVNSLEDILERTTSLAKDIADDYLHNVIKIHGNQKNILERCIFGIEGQEKHSDFVQAVKNKMSSSLDESAEDICALVKETRLVDYHIGAYNLFHNLSPKPNITENHNLKKFLLGLSHLFFDSLNKNNITLSLHKVNSNFKCAFEYETLNVAMHCFIENLVKYVKPYTTVYADSDDSNGRLVFTMESIRIEKKELSDIYERGVSGSNVPSDLRGNGIGMYQLKKAIDRSGISLNIDIDYSQNSEVDEIAYTKNTFTFHFSEYSV
ncbi:MAG: hypothetical protein PHU45_05355 [Bacilli bacterium]|nr:hypothetical protein [Bacilli bacterium]